MTKRRIAAAIITLAAALGLSATIAASAPSSTTAATHYWG